MTVAREKFFPPDRFEAIGLWEDVIKRSRPLHNISKQNTVSQSTRVRRSTQIDEQQENASPSSSQVSVDPVTSPIANLTANSTLCTDDQHEVDHPSDQKYFHEIMDHLDARFASLKSNKSHRNETECLESLTGCISAWSRFAASNYIPTWIAHGTLLSWFWNQKVFPWEVDVDFQMPIKHLLDLWRLNGTMIDGRYLLDINPNSIHRRHQDNNVIDARVIDTRTGLYLDITALAVVDDKLACKSPHQYTYDEVFPLHSTMIEGVPVWRPHKAILLLAR
ncbi:hypothetical protein HK102_006431, partial [Quaeritorhiza haematococci]